jgi:chromosome segregation ATPase
MAERGIDPQEEKKSYGSVFLLGIALLVALSIWAFWDDNITRRPWKAFQSQFFRLDYNKAQAAYEEENKKLQADPAYQELTKKLAAFQASIEDGELGEKLATLEKQESEASVRFGEIDQEVKFIKSELEEAWYEHDHAIQQKRDPKPYAEHIQELEKEKAKLDPELQAARLKRDNIRDEIKKINSSSKELQTEVSKLSAELSTKFLRSNKL